MLGGPQFERLARRIGRRAALEAIAGGAFALGGIGLAGEDRAIAACRATGMRCSSDATRRSGTCSAPPATATQIPTATPICAGIGDLCTLPGDCCSGTFCSYSPITPDDRHCASCVANGFNGCLFSSDCCTAGFLCVHGNCTFE